MQWKKIIYENYETNYSISEEGIVRNDKTGRILSNSFQNGYYSIRLSVAPNVGKHFRINRLVAQAFIPNPENKQFVNHIDGDKTNNYYKNLEWVSPSENSLHAYKNGLREKTRAHAVCQYSLQGSLMMTYKTLDEAELQTKVSSSKISEVCRGRRFTAGEFQWRYAEENIDQLPAIEQRKNISKKVAQYDLENNLIAIYNSFREAARQIGGDEARISRVCGNVPGCKTHRGYKWKIVDDIVQNI